MMKTVLRYNKKDVMITSVIFILMIPTLRPAAQAVPSLINRFYSFFGLGVIGVMPLFIFQYVRQKSKYLDWSIILSIVLYTSVTLLSTFINSGNFMGYLYASIKQIVPLFYIGLELQIHPKCAQRALLLLSGVIASANLLTMVIFPEGVFLTELTRNRAFLFGHKNSVPYYALLFFCVAIAGSAWSKRKNVWYVFYSACITIMTAVLSKSSTGIVVTVIAIVALFLYWFEFKFFTFDVRIPVYAIWGLNVSIVFFRIQSRFSYIIESLLEKKLDFTNRTMIWDRAIGQITKNPVIGHGNEFIEVVRQKLTLDSTHNTMLSCLYVAGIVGLVIYSLYILHIAKRINAGIISGVGKFFSCILYAILIAQFMESLDTNICVNLILFICAYGGLLQKETLQSGRPEQGKKNHIKVNNLYAVRL